MVCYVIVYGLYHEIVVHRQPVSWTVSWYFDKVLCELLQHFYPFWHQQPFYLADVLNKEYYS